MRKRCLYPGCRILITGARSYCITHQPYGTGWDRLRASILKRDGYVCQIGGGAGYCKLWATTVDHIDGNPHNNHPANLQAACRECNTAKGGALIA